MLELIYTDKTKDSLFENKKLNNKLGNLIIYQKSFHTGGMPVLQVESLNPKPSLSLSFSLSFTHTHTHTHTFSKWKY
jgi:hypothetical protein